MEGSKICLTCMNTYSGDRCPKCGGTNKSTSQPPYLKTGLFLQDRYLVGKMREQNSESVLYAAFDQETNSRILLREFFPQMICLREPDGHNVGVMAGGEELYQQTKNAFLTLGRKVAHFRDQTAILPVFDIFEDNNTAYIVYEWNHGGTLRDYISRKGAPMSWNMAKKLFFPLLAPLSEMHKVGIGHYGISPDNLYLYADGKMKLAGFCISDIRREEQDLTPELFPGFSALEQYSSNRPLGEATDVYGFAACMFYALTATEPQEAVRRKYDDRLLVANDALEQIPNFIVNAITSALQVDVSRRTKTFEDLRRAFVGAQIMSETEHKEEHTTTIPTVKTEAPPKPIPTKEPVDVKPAVLKIGRLPDFVTALLAFLVTFGFLWLFGWKIFGVKKDISMILPKDKASSVTSSDTASVTESNASSKPEDNPVESIPEGSIAVPSLVGMTLEEAKSVPNFIVFQQGSDYSDEVKKGTVISQSLTGYALPKSVITVIISQGPAEIELPDIIGQKLSAAKTMLQESGFELGDVIKEQSEEAPNTVLSYKDSSLVIGEKYKTGTTVDIVVASK